MKRCKDCKKNKIIVRHIWTGKPDVFEPCGIHEVGCYRYQRKWWKLWRPKRRCIDCVYFCRVNHYTDSILTGVGIGCKKMIEWGSPNPKNCEDYKRKWWKLWRPN